MAIYLSIDIGGTYIKSAFIDSEHKLFDHKQVATKVNHDQTILKQVEGIIQAATKEFTVKGVGISTAGVVDREKGEIIYAGPTIKNYIGTGFKAHLCEKYNLPIHVENDVNAALLGEIWQGAGRNQNNVYCITLGTGIGGAHFYHQLIDGDNHQASEIGYLLYDTHTKTNYEMRASTQALNHIIETELGKNLSTKAVFEKAKNGDSTCISIIESWSEEVAKGLAQIIILTDPACIIIGGGISAQGNYLLEFIEKQVPRYLPDNFFKTKLKIAELFNDAALYGAVYPFFNKLK